MQHTKRDAATGQFEPHSDEEKRYLGRGKSPAVATAENEGDIPAPFAESDVPPHEEQSRLDEALRAATQAEVISEDGAQDGDADDPGQA